MAITLPSDRDSRRAQQPQWLRLSRLRRRRAARSQEARELWATFLVAHGDDAEAALGEVVAALLDADLLARERS